MNRQELVEVLADKRDELHPAFSEYVICMRKRMLYTDTDLRMAWAYFRQGWEASEAKNKKR